MKSILVFTIFLISLFDLSQVRSIQFHPDHQWNQIDQSASVVQAIGLQHIDHSHHDHQTNPHPDQDCLHQCHFGHCPTLPPFAGLALEFRSLTYSSNIPSLKNLYQSLSLATDSPPPKA